MNIVDKTQFLKVINSCNDSQMISVYPIDSIRVINNIDNVSMIVKNEDGEFINILSGIPYVGNIEDKISISFKEYVLDNITLFDQNLIDAMLDSNNFDEVSFSVNDFFKYYDKLKNKVIDPSEKEVVVLDDGTIIEKVISSCDRTSILDKLISLHGVSEESILALICDTSINFETEKTITRDITGKVLIDSFIVMADNNIIIDDKCQLYYFNINSNGIFKKNITCQSDIDNYKNYFNNENYDTVLKVNLELEKNKCMIYK